MYPILAAMVEVTENGESVKIDPTGPMLFTALYIALIMLPIMLVIWLFFYRSKLRHQQIALAIEKGVPVSELNITKKPKKTNWITERTSGISMLIIGVGIAIILFLTFSTRQWPPLLMLLFIVPIVFIGQGIGAIIRSKMLKDNPGMAQAENDEKSADFTAKDSLQQ